MDKIQEMKNKLAAIVAKLKQYEAVNEFTAEDQTSIDGLSAEFETLSAQIQTAEKLESMKAKATAAAPRQVTPGIEARIEVGASVKELNGGFSNMGEYLMAVKNSAGGKLDRRFNNTLFEKNGEDGGFLVPETFISTISKKLESDESLLSKVTKINVSGNSLSLPTDEQAPWNSGIVAYWTAEGAPITDSKNKLGSASWRLHKMAAMVKVTDELLEDSVGLESYVLSKAPEAMMWKLNSAILSGDGVGKPTGILNSGFKITVAKEAAQAADTIVAKNIVKMYSAMIPASRPKAAWYINAGCEEQLRLMKDDLGNFIYLAPGSQLNQTPYGMLMGLPVISLIGSMPALGDAGDIVLADLSYYTAIVKTAGIKQSVSTHLFFDRDIQAYKWTFRVDGSCPYKAPVTTEFGNHQMSAIVTLAERA